MKDVFEISNVRLELESHAKHESFFEAVREPASEIVFEIGHAQPSGFQPYKHWLQLHPLPA